MNAWFSGPLTSVFGLHGYWIARFAKLLQFVGGLAVVAEIVGPERLRAFGEQLRDRPEPRTILREARDSAMWPVYWWTSKFGSEKRSRRAVFELRRMGIHATNALSFVLALAAAAVIPWWLPTKGSFSYLVTGAFVFLAVNTFVAPAIAAALVVLASGLRVFFAAFVFEPLAKLLTRDRPDTTIKIGAIVLVTVGFALDMLSS